MTLGVVDVSRLTAANEPINGAESARSAPATADSFAVKWMDVDCGPASLGGRVGLNPKP